MAVIYRYVVKPQPEVQKIEFPLGTRLISAIEQRGEIVIYGVVDNPDQPEKETKKLLVVGTGWTFELNEWLGYDVIGTVKVGSFVWHVIELQDLPF